MSACNRILAASLLVAVLRLPHFSDAQFLPTASDSGFFFPLVPGTEIPPVGWIRRRSGWLIGPETPQFFGRQNVFDVRGQLKRISGAGNSAALGVTDVINGDKELVNSADQTSGDEDSGTIVAIPRVEEGGSATAQPQRIRLVLLRHPTDGIIGAVGLRLNNESGSGFSHEASDPIDLLNKPNDHKRHPQLGSYEDNWDILLTSLHFDQQGKPILDN